jgi:lipoprotein-releasing system ATP-binding protein
LLERVGITDRLDHLPGELSGGEQQRVAVARALVNRPKIVLADEPGGNLDHARARSLHELLIEFSHSEDLGIVIVTHDESLAAEVDRWLHLAEGRLEPGRPSNSLSSNEIA